MSDVLAQALTLYKSGDVSAAKDKCAAAISADDGNAMAYQLMGVLHSLDGDLNEALRYLQKAAALDRTDEQIKFNLAKCFRDLGRYLEAADLFNAIATAAPGRADVWVELGAALNKAEVFDKAAAATERALALGPQSANVVSNLASMYLQMGDLDRAETAARSALSLEEDLKAAWINLAVVYECRDDYDAAIEIYGKLLEADPGYHKAAIRHALALLSSGNLREGWRAYAKRPAWAETVTCYGAVNAKYWDGEPREGKSLLIWTEQGLGDEILCGTLINGALTNQDGVTIACSERMAPVFTRSFPGARVVARSDSEISAVAGETFDLQASITELGMAVQDTQPEPFRGRPYLVTDPVKVESYRKTYSAARRDKPVIGLSWQSGSAKTRHQKSSQLREWADVLSGVDATFVSLQYGNAGDQIAALRQQTGLEILSDPDFDARVHFDEFVHQVAAMDLVISVSNTTVHVAGALGRDVWTLVPRGIGRPWYWFIDGRESLWYPTMTLYRQHEAGQWSAPLQAVRDDLKSWVSRWPSPTP